MKALAVLLLAICAVEARKVVPINKNANVDFINMEGGGARPAPVPLSPIPAKPQSFEPPKTPTVAQPNLPIPVPTRSPVPSSSTASPQIKSLMPQPAKVPNQMDPRPVPPRPTVGGITGPGNFGVKELITFYDTKGQASVIRPYSYADAVKKH